MKPEDIATMREVLLERLKEKSFTYGPASDTPNNVHTMSQADKLILRAFQDLLVDGLVTETPTHFRSAGHYNSCYRLREMV